MGYPIKQSSMLPGAVCEGIDSPPMYGTSQSRQDLLNTGSEKTNIRTLVHLLATFYKSCVSMFVLV